MAAVVIQPVVAQDNTPTLTVSLRKDFGYSSFGDDIQGVFSIKARGPEDLNRVVFYIDGQVMGEVETAPFNLRFDTGNYPLGKHTLSAIGYTAAGQELFSNELVREFVPASEGFTGVLDILLPLFGVIIVAGLLAWGIPAFLQRGKPKGLPAGAVRNYGLLGGTICPKCGRPFAIHMYGLNMVVGKLDRCPNCGKWSLVTRTSSEALRAAEAAELEQAAREADPGAYVIPEASEEEKLRKDLDNSRYQDL